MTSEVNLNPTPKSSPQPKEEKLFRFDVMFNFTTHYAGLKIANELKL